jgi:hypothetical protein
MPYGTIKVDTITFTDAGVDKSVTISGLVQNPTFTGNVTATGTISGLIVQAPTVTGTTANFASGVYTTQISGAIVKVPAGTAGAPSIQVGVGASVAPGLYSPGTDQLALNTGGAGRLFIASDGRVGVGAANVTGGINLEVIGSAPTLRVTGTSASNAKFELVSVGATLWSQICSGSDGSLSFNRDGTERMRLDSSGRLLLGQSTNPDGYYFIVNTGSGSNNNAVQLSNNANADLRINLTSGVSLINANTGILALGTSGTERLRIDSSGNVGIGTATTISGVKLNVDTGINCNGLNVSGTGGFFNSANKFGVDNNAGITRMYSSGPNTSTRGSYDFRATDSVGTLDESRMVIDSSGRVGIGTSSPVQKLDVAGVIRGGDASATSGALILEGLYSGSDVINTFGSQHSSAATVIGYGVRPRNGTTGYTSTTGISSLFRGALEVGGADVAVRVLYAGASTTPIGNVITMSEAMRIDNAGRVGIGTSSPGYKLEVFGTSNANEIRSSDGTTISQWYQDTGGISYFGTVSNHPLAFKTNSSERMRIDSSGNVGIGTGAPGAKLHVIGFEARIESPIANDGFLRFTNTSGSMSIGMSGAPTNALLIADRINSQVAYTYNGGASGSHVWATNNIERLRIDGSGRVGIGTSNPGAPIEVAAANSAGASTVARLRHDNGADQHYFDITVNADTDTVKLISSGSANGSIILGTAAVDALVTTNSGNVGIGTSSPGELLEVSKAASGTLNGEVVLQRIRSNTSNFVFLDIKSRRHTAGSDWTGVGLRLQHQVDSTLMGFLEFNSTNSSYDVVLGTSTVAPILFKISNTEAARFDSGGRLLVGTSTARTLNTVTAALEVEGTSFNGSSISIINNENTANGAFLNFGKSRGASVGSNTIVNSGDNIAHILFYGANGSGTNIAAGIDIQVDGTPGVNDMPGRIMFSTTADGASSPTERLRIDSSGNVGIGTSSPRGQLSISNNVAGSVVDSTLHFGYSAADYYGFRIINTNNPSNTAAGLLRFQRGTVLNWTDALIINNNGSLLVGTSTLPVSSELLAVVSSQASPVAVFKTDYGAAAQPLYCWNSATTGDNKLIEFATETSATVRGLIDYNRGAGQVRYNVTSDRRLKSNIQDSESALDILNQIKVRSYAWSETGYNITHGFIAQELNEAVPDAVKIGDDGEEVVDTWAVDNTKLVPVLTKALQEAIAKIETLEARLAAAGIA